MPGIVDTLFSRATGARRVVTTRLPRMSSERRVVTKRTVFLSPGPRFVTVHTRVPAANNAGIRGRRSPKERSRASVTLRAEAYPEKETKGKKGERWKRNKRARRILLAR